MEAVSSIKAAVTTSPYFTLFCVLVFIAVIIVISYVLSHTIKQYSVRATSSNIKRIETSQNLKIEKQYSLYSNNVKGNTGLWGDTPKNQQLLINMNMTGVRISGYLGPFQDGVFSADKAVKTALMTGARLFIIDIDVDTITNKPTLVYRDKNGYIKSLNSETIKNVAKSINERGFSGYEGSVPIDVRGLPMIVVLYFHKTPDAVKKPKDYIKFLMEVSSQLKDIKPHLLGQTAQGDFRRQGMDTQLFFQPISIFMNKIIILCNVDTSIMRISNEYGINLGGDNDLDLIVNARLYSQTSGSSFGASSTVKGTTKPAAIIADPDDFLKTPQQNRGESILSTKSYFTIVMKTDPSQMMTKEDLQSLITDYGVHCVPFVHFLDISYLLIYFGVGNLYEKSSVLAKLKTLMFLPPSDIVTQVPNSNTNTRGGFIELSNV